MKSSKITLLNTSVLTSYGVFSFKCLPLAEARRIASEATEVQSAIGHASTAVLLSELLEIPVSVNRTEYSQAAGDTALIFKLKSRVTENKVLSRESVEAIGYEFGLLERLQ